VRVLLLTLCVLGACAGVISSSAQASVPLQAAFERCHLDARLSTCNARLDQMHQGGLGAVLDDSVGYSLPNMQAYAGHANAIGMQTIWAIGNTGWWDASYKSTGKNMLALYASFASACGCKTNQQLLTYMVQWLANLPGTWGWYIADDTWLCWDTSPQGNCTLAQKKAQHDRLKNFAAAVKKAAPSKKGIVANFGSADQYWGVNDLTYYQDVSDMVAAEAYPVKYASTGADPVGAAITVSNVAVKEQQAASAAGKSSAMILQAFTWGDNLGDGMAVAANGSGCASTDTPASCNSKLRYPNAEELSVMRHAALNNSSPTIVLWYYFPDTAGFSSTSETCSPTQLDTPGAGCTVAPTTAETQTRWADLSAALTRPYAATGSAAGVTRTSATLNGTVNPYGQSTTARFDYGTTTAYGSSTASTSAGSGTSDQSLSATLTGLSAGTTYHYRLEATNATGTAYGADNTFTTLPPPYRDAVLGTPGLLGYWRLGEASGPTAADETAANPGTYTGGVALGQPGALTSDSNAAALFDGVNGQVSLPGSLALPLNSPVSIEFWAYVSSADVGSRSAFTIGGLNTPDRAQAHVPWSNRVLYWDYGSLTSGRMTADYTSHLDRWTHVVLVSQGRGGTFQGIYLDGQLVSSRSSSDGPTQAVSGGSIAAWPSNGLFQKGMIDEFSVYNTVLPATTIQQHYNAGIG
jgi:hypothetical protein